MVGIIKWFIEKRKRIDLSRDKKIRRKLREEIDIIILKWDVSFSKPVGDMTILEFSKCIVLKTKFWKIHCNIKIRDL